MYELGVSFMCAMCKLKSCVNLVGLWNVEFCKMPTAFSFRSILRTLSLSVPLTLIFCDNVAYIARVDGVSMQPTLNPEDKQSEPSDDQKDRKSSRKKYFNKFNSSDLILLSHWATRNYQIQRGYVVSLISPKNPSQIIIKRVIGLEGDIVISRRDFKFESIKIPKGHCWVEGDNHCKSMDSNMFGPVAVGLITAQAKYVIWPPKQWKTLPNEFPSDRTMKKLSLFKNRKFDASYHFGESFLIDLKDGPRSSSNTNTNNSLTTLDLISMFDDSF